MELQKKWKSQYGGTEYMIQINGMDLDHIIAGLKILRSDAEREYLKLDYDLQKFMDLKRPTEQGAATTATEQSEYFKELLGDTPNGEGAA